MAEHQYIIIVGCGRLGSHLANELSHHGHSVVVIDAEGASFGALSPEFSGFRLEGDATEPSVLKQAKMDQADLVIATTREDNINLMVAQFALKLHGVPRVMARVFDPSREQFYRTLGIDTICPTSVAAGLFLESLTSAPDSAAEESTP
ncbi:MAG: TrkA family potassium uptake protein [Phycisphaerae bacterium]